MKRGNICRISNTLLLATIIAACLVSQPIITHAAAKAITKIDGVGELGDSKTKIILKLGIPNSPQKFDFFYIKGGAEIAVIFNDKTKRVEAMIVRGDKSKYAIGGIKLGDSRSIVKKVFGEPEKVKKYVKNGVDCWYYSSTNTSFAFRGEKVVSFSVSSCIKDSCK